MNPFHARLALSLAPPPPAAAPAPPAAPLILPLQCYCRRARGRACGLRYWLLPLGRTEEVGGCGA